MNSSPDVALVQGLREAARPIVDADPHDGLIEAIGDARVVMLGEASHGTHDFYAERARITQRLIVEKGFHAVAVEADWPDAFRVNRFVRASSEVDPQAARVARDRYRCFDDFGGNVEDYARSAALGVIRSCEDAVVQQLVDLLHRAGRTAAGSGGDPDEEGFQAVQNARVVKNAERYYRTMYRGNVESWNLRDRHMAETVEEILQHLDRRVGRGSRGDRAEPEGARPAPRREAPGDHPGSVAPLRGARGARGRGAPRFHLVPALPGRRAAGVHPGDPGANAMSVSSR
jgi:erythromycin esterase-like protein